MTYELTPGTAAYRIVGWLEAQGRTKEFNSAQIAYALHLDAKGLPTQLAPALQAGIVFRRQKDSSSPRAPFWYSLTDHGAVHRREFRPAPKDWMQPINRKDAEESGSSPGTPGTAGTPAGTCASSAEVAAADAPSGDKGAAADADRAAAPALDTSAPGSQQVLKAEAARPDATDRETPDTASPGVGPMGAGQPADAGTTEEDQRSGGVDGHAAADEQATPRTTIAVPGDGKFTVVNTKERLRAFRALVRAYSKAIPTALDTIPSMRPKGVPPGETQSQGSRAAGVESGPLHHDEQPREVDAQFAASLAAAMAYDDDALARGAELGRREDHLPPADLAATRRAVHAPRVGYDEHGGKLYCRECGQIENQPHLSKCSIAFRAARFTDGSLHFERHGQVIASLSAAEVDVLVQLLGARA